MRVAKNHNSIKSSVHNPQALPLPDTPTLLGLSAGPHSISSNGFSVPLAQHPTCIYVTAGFITYIWNSEVHVIMSCLSFYNAHLEDQTQINWNSCNLPPTPPPLSTPILKLAKPDLDFAARVEPVSLDHYFSATVAAATCWESA